VLRDLLPEIGTDIKGNMRSEQELLARSGYTERPKEFADLMRILIRETRLVMPTDPEGIAREEEGTKQEALSGDRLTTVPRPQRYYELTHDYLVRSLRQWLTQEQGKRAAGRAQLRLAERAALWNSKPERRYLPSWVEWARIRLLTRRRDWTPPERKMMQKAGRYHAARNFLLAVIVALLGWGSYQGYGRLKSEALRDQLLKADIQNVPGIVEEMGPYRRWINLLLHEAYNHSQAGAEPDSRARLHASIALLPVDASQTAYLYPRLLDATPQEVAVLCDVLAPHRGELRDELWSVAEHPVPGKEHRRLRAACALAKYDPQSERWATVAARVVDDLVAVPPAYLERWMNCLKPVSDCPAVLHMFRRAYAKEQYTHHSLWEQLALAEALRECSDSVRLRVVSRRLLNSFAGEYQKGDFIIHYAGWTLEAKLHGVRKLRAGMARNGR
jgi:hypothetical protein